MKTGKTGKTKQLFGPDIKDSKTAFKYEIRPGLVIYKRKIESKKTRKHALVQENTHASRKKDLLKKSRT